MTTILNASNGATSGLIATGDNSGVLQLQTNNGTPALTLNATQALGVGSSPSYGTSGQVLTSGGTSASPTWTTPSSGAMTLISTQTASGSSYLTWSGLTTYNNYYLVVDGLKGSTNNTQLYFQFGEGSTPTWQTSNYNVSFVESSSSGTANTNVYPGNANGFLGYNGALSTISGNGNIVTVNFVNFLSSSVYKTYVANYCYISGSAGATVNTGIFGGSYVGDTNPITAIRLFASSGNIASGTASLYGISS